MEPINVDSKGVKNAKNTVVIRPGKLDRSPCGTGTSARLALLRRNNQIEIGEKIISQSIIGSTFEAFIKSEIYFSRVYSLGMAWAPKNVAFIGIG